MTSNIQKAFKAKSKLRAMVDGGKVKGKGGPTDDKVGPVMLSDGEYVLPADTVKVVGRDKLDALRLATHDFVDDRNKPKTSSLRKMADGGVFYVDSEGVASRRPPTGREMVPYQPPGAPSTTMAPSSAPSRAPQARAGGLSRLATPVMAALEGKNVYDAYQTGGAQAAGNEAMMSGARLAGARLGASVGGSLPLPGPLRAATALAGGAVGYLAPDAVANSQLGKDTVLLDAYSRQIEEGLSPKFDARTNTISTADGRVFGSGRLESDPHLQLAGYVGNRAQQALRDKEVLFNPTPQVLEAAGALRPQQAGGGAAPQPRPSEGSPDMSNTPAGVRTSSAGMPATPVQPQSYQSRRLAEMGVPVDQQNLAPVTEDTRRSLLREGGGMPGQYVNLGSYGGDANIYGTASNPGGRIDTFVGVGAPARPGGGPQEDPIMGEIRSALRGLIDGAGNRGGGGGAPRDIGSAREINARYDNLLRSGSGRNIVRGLDWSQRHGLDLERARALELGELARNQSALRGQDLQAATAANNADMQARMQALQILGTMANQRSLQDARAQADLFKALQDAQDAAREGEEKGFERYTSAIGSMFVGPDGKPDAAEQERFTAFLQASDPQASEKFAAMSPQDQMVLLQNFKTLYDMQKARNATATAGLLNSGAITNRADMPVDVREATWNDVWNNHLPVSDYLYSNLPFTNPNVVVTESGQPVLLSDYATTDGNWDADKLEMIRQRTGKDREGRSALRRD